MRNISQRWADTSEPAVSQAANGIKGSAATGYAGLRLDSRLNLMGKGFADSEEKMIFHLNP